MQRFTPDYWTINFNTTANAAVVTTSADALLVTIDFRTTHDLVGLFWQSTDAYSPTSYAYGTNNDYSTASLAFNFVLTNVRALDDVNGPTMTVTHLDNTQQFVRLAVYKDSGTFTNGHITLNFPAV